MIKRYSKYYEDIYEDENGEWVRFADVEEIIKAASQGKEQAAQANNSAMDAICPFYSSEYIASAGHCVNMCHCQGKRAMGKQHQ